MSPSMLTCSVGVQSIFAPVTSSKNANNSKENEEYSDKVLLQPMLLETIFSSHRVNIPPEDPSNHILDLDPAIESLKLLIVELKSVIESGAQIDKKDSSPGFMTINHNGMWVHHIHQFFGRYETLVDPLLFPMPSPSVALHCFSQILQTWNEKRLIQKLKPFRDNLSVCPCFDEWRHCKKNVIMALANHTLEQVSY